MSTSSAIKQIDADFSSAPEVTGLGPSSPTGASSSARSARPSTEILDFPRFPSFSYTKDAEVAASKFANRVVAAAATNEAEHERLLDERQRLLDREFAGEITPEEQNRLAYVRWSLDRIDDARFGAEMERLQFLAYQYERFHADIAKFQAELERLRKSRRSYP
jgi:hypothetical protein